MGAAKINDEQFLSVIQTELQSASSWAQEHIQSDQLKNLQYYLGMPLGNEVKGRSQIVSWDVFEAVESAMPGFIEPFFAADNIATFQPRGVEDEAYAEQATDYINYVVKQRNPGFQIFCTWIKDALLSKVGVVRVDWEKEEPKRRQYRGQTQEQIVLLAQDPSTQIIEHKAYPVPGMPPLSQAQMIQAGGQVPMLHDVTVLQGGGGCVKVENVRPENFVLTSGIGLISKARAIGEWVTYTRGDLVEMGIKQAMDVDSFNIASIDDGQLQSLREGEDSMRSMLRDDSTDPSLEEVKLFKGFVRCDRNGDGVAEWRRVLIGDGEDPILQDDEAEDHNYAVISPIPIPHRVIGLAYADVARPIHELKTALTRQYLDSLYLSNRPRTYVNTSAGVNLDDLLSDRIGGIIRGTGPAQNAIMPIQTTAVSRDALEGLQLADGMRETRLGIPKFNPGLESDALHKTATGVRSVNNLVDKRQKMTLRIMAETGIKDLFRLVLKMTTEYQDAPAVARIRGKFVPFDPRQWNPDLDVSVEVGVGTSDEAETMMMLQQFAQFMAMAQQSGSGVIQPANIYEFGKMLAKNARIKGADLRLLTDPKTLPPPQPPQDPKLALEQFKAQQEQMRFQAEAQIEQQRQQFETQAQMATDRNRQEMEARQKTLEAEQQAQLEMLKQASSDRQASERLEFERWKVQFMADQAIQLEAMRQQFQAPVDTSAPILQRLDELAQWVTAPVEMVRDKAGAISVVRKGGRDFRVTKDEQGRPAGLQ